MGSLLEKVNSPQDLRQFEFTELEELAGEIRKKIVETVSRTGGHLAPNLGVVELSIALHRVFCTPHDKIIWDVGHQCYVHKLLTGRREKFDTLRQLGGISGFPLPSESPHDAFGTGHSSTSISAALGMALARDLKGEKYSVVAVIGDGAMTGGMAFEALNHAGHLKKDLIVVLNDNEMSIAQNVGAMSGYLTRLRTDPVYSRGKEEIEQLLRRMPIGSTLLRIGEKLKDSLKYLVVPGMIFEELGFTYLGPVDGHSIRDLCNVLNKAKSLKGPILIHVLTKKGKGYAPAEKNPDRFHGTGAFDVQTGKPIKNSSVPTYTEVFGSTLVKLASLDKRLVAVTAAMTSGTGLENFARLYPDRFFDVGIAEQHAVTMAAGMAKAGLRPVVAIYSTFLQRAYDQIIHDVCLQNLPVKFAVDRAGIVGEDGATHQGLFDLSFLRSIPNMVVMAPKDENELQHMLATAFFYEGPAAVRYPRGSGTGCQLDTDLRELPVGKAEVLRDGTDVALLAAGNTVAIAEAAARELSSLGVGAAVINARFVKPLDEECILYYAELTGRIVTVEENLLQGGFGSAVLELLAARGLCGTKVHCLGVNDTFVEHGKPAQLREKLKLTAEYIAEVVLGKEKSSKRLRKLKVAFE